MSHIKNILKTTAKRIKDALDCYKELKSVRHIRHEISYKHTEDTLPWISPERCFVKLWNDESEV